MYICIVAALVLLAGLMSGLTLGLMSMDVLDMEVRRLPWRVYPYKHCAALK